MADQMGEKVILGSTITLDMFVSVARNNAYVDFSTDYCERVSKSCQLVNKGIEKEKVMYGVNTGFGALSTQLISSDQTKLLQKNILLSHATSVGEPLEEECVRAIMLMVLQNLGQGYSGVRLETLEMYRQLLNHRITPYVPREGSVGYLSVEAHIALVLLGEGKVYLDGELLPSSEGLSNVGLEPLKLAAKEGLALINGTTSPTGIGALALYDMLRAAKTADIIGAMSLEVLRGTLRAYDDRLMSVRLHEDQRNTAANVRNILSDSMIAKQSIDYRLQDALSLRAIPQLHGAAKKTLLDALRTFEIEVNSCCDNPILWPDEIDGGALSGSNCDSSYLGIELDSVCIAVTAIAKMSERRNNRLIHNQHSNYPYFLIQRAGLNSGLMIPQYTQAGLLNDMRMLSHPATIDSIPTCADQEDYVAMGYNSAKKAREVANKLEYILAIELLSVYTAHQFVEDNLSPGSASNAVIEFMAQSIPVMEEDMYLYPFIEKIQDMIHSGEIIQIVETKIGKLL
ncbi:aromatic amino acid ammonia-lyase [Halobacillus shinanisalinarum]|uniref:Aromatic amino acid ammonia-lyase n=1 Tax=Halobacillus shinanisalinarum TaxID=2932258 RepID=A0ABY4H4J8_9BACI|nr:aromatic amino acid ammonia-lyase [Halobacillus shinanisalinarum]UOQ94820.1 aromatic amino acid ammonia-lyase [Halobacillus shinanisalinarum]